MNTFSQSAEAGPAASDSRQCLTFYLAGQEYGVDILSVREIRGWTGATTLPNVPDYVRGVINLRGEVVPIIDLRERFGFESAEYGPATVVVVLNLGAAEHNQLKEFGIVVDAVAEVHTFDADTIKPAPSFDAPVDESYILGLTTQEEQMIILLHPERLLNKNVQSTVSMLTEQNTAAQS